MARAKTTLKDIKPKSTKPDIKIICTECGQEKNAKKDFYISYNSKLSIAPFSKDCVIKNSLTVDGESIDIEKFQNVLQRLDRPYLNQLYITSIKEGNGNPQTVVGFYMKNISTPQYRVLKFAHSDFGHLENEIENQQASQTKKETPKKPSAKMDSKTRIELSEKWGEYADNELLRFEKKYQQMSKSYQILTTLHDEGLIDFCRLQCLYEMAVERKDMQEAKIFKSLADDAKKAAKLNPLQLDKADLTAGGCNSFGEIARIVSKRDGVCRLPLKYLQQPNDRIDYAIYQFISYERALRGLPEPEYEEIYAWYINNIKRLDEHYKVEPEFIKVGEE